MLILTLLGCPVTPDDTGPLPLTVKEAIELEATDMGGFDNWDGVALGWAVDTDAGLTFVAGAAYEGGTATFDYVPSDDAAETAGAWDVEVPQELEDAVATWPMLGAVVSDAAGVRLLPMDFAAVVARGDPTSATPESLWVAVQGSSWLRRTDGPGDELFADLTFVEVSGFGHGAEVVDPAYGLAVDDVAIAFSSGTWEE